MSERTFKSQYESHDRWVSRVKFNENVENLFISSSYDGTVKVWDVRNEETPLFTLKRKQESPSDEYKVFATEWNGPSQIISGGSDSKISVHTIGDSK
jgi:ribosome biogenesis protein YTM1